MTEYNKYLQSVHKKTRYLDLKGLKAVHSQCSHWRFFKNYPSFCLIVSPFTLPLHTHIFLKVVGCFVLCKTIFCSLKTYILSTLSHFTHKFECTYFQPDKTTWPSSSILWTLSHLYRPSSISSLHFQSMILLTLRQLLCFALLRNPSSVSEVRSQSGNPSPLHTFIPFPLKWMLFSAAVCNSQSLNELKTTENSELDT